MRSEGRADVARALYARAARRRALRSAAPVVARPPRAALWQARRRALRLLPRRAFRPAARLGARGFGRGGAWLRGAGACLRRRASGLRGAGDLHDRERPRDAEGAARRVGADRLAALRLSGLGAAVPRALSPAPRAAGGDRDLAQSDRGLRGLRRADAAR